MPEFLRNSIDRIKSAWAAKMDRVSDWSATGDDAGARRWLPWARWAAIALVLILVIYYPVGMALYHRINDQTAFEAAPPFTVENGSKAVATAAAVMMREAERWAPNKPWWMPAAALDNMPNFQLGLQYAAARFAVESGDYLGRVRGSSAIDPNLDRAAGLLRYDGTIWYWGQGNVVPMAKAEDQYEKAVDALLAYNRDVASGAAVFDKRPDNLIAFLDRVAADLGSASAALDSRSTAADAGFFDRTADDLFYNVKGRLYGYYLILRDLGVDFAPVIAEKQATGIWDNMITSLRTGAEMDPLFVANSAPDSVLGPSHLATMGFYLLRARTQMRELTDAMQK